jgi:hypothetical protein
MERFLSRPVTPCRICVASPGRVREEVADEEGEAYVARSFARMGEIE